MAAYVRYNPTWYDWPDTRTPVTAAFLQAVEDALVNAPNKTPSADTDNQIIPVSDKVIALAVGNDAATNLGPNTGNPPGNYIPFKVQQLIGTAGVDVTQTRQGGVGWAKYKERTVDDSMEGFSFGVLATSAYGGFVNQQMLPVVGLEGDALVQGTASVANKVIGVTGGVKIQNTAHADTVANIYAAQSLVDAGASVGDVIAFYAESPTVLGTQTGHTWSLHAAEDARFLKSVVIGSSTTTAARVFIQNAAASANPAVALAAGSGQTGNTLEVRDSSNNKLWVVDVAGLPRWFTSANEQTTVGAAGGASALPATPTKFLKVKDSTGATLVIPAYAS